MKDSYAWDSKYKILGNILSPFYSLISAIIVISWLDTEEPFLGDGDLSTWCVPSFISLPKFLFLLPVVKKTCDTADSLRGRDVTEVFLESSEAATLRSVIRFLPVPVVVVVVSRKVMVRRTLSSRGFHEVRICQKKGRVWVTAWQMGVGRVPLTWFSTVLHFSLCSLSFCVIPWTYNNWFCQANFSTIW